MTSSPLTLSGALILWALAILVAVPLGLAAKCSGERSAARKIADIEKRCGVAPTSAPESPLFDKDTIIGISAGALVGLLMVLSMVGESLTR